MLSLQDLYAAYDETHRPPEPERTLTAMQRFCKRRLAASNMSAFERINQCRRGLEALDRQGWNRSQHQREFHEEFLRACARIFYKRERPGTFQRDHQKLLQLNGWKNLSQEILISTPRRCELIRISWPDRPLTLPRSRQDHLGEPVCGRHHLQRPPGRDEHLQHVQTDQPEAVAQREEIFGPHLPGARHTPV